MFLLDFMTDFIKEHYLTASIYVYSYPKRNLCILNKQQLLNHSQIFLKIIRKKECNFLWKSFQ